MTTFDVNGRLTIVEAMESLRTEIGDAIEHASGEGLTFEINQLEVELQLTVTTVVKGEAKAGLWSVVTVGGGIDRSSAALHKVKLLLEPRMSGRGRLPISEAG